MKPLRHTSLFLSVLALILVTSTIFPVYAQTGYSTTDDTAHQLCDALHTHDINIWLADHVGGKEWQINARMDKAEHNRWKMNYEARHADEDGLQDVREYAECCDERCAENERLCQEAYELSEGCENATRRRVRQRIQTCLNQTVEECRRCRDTIQACKEKCNKFGMEYMELDRVEKHVSVHIEKCQKAQENVKSGEGPKLGNEEGYGKSDDEGSIGQGQDGGQGGGGAAKGEKPS